jgi:hypothetical protein
MRIIIRGNCLSPDFRHGDMVHSIDKNPFEDVVLEKGDFIIYKGQDGLKSIKKIKFLPLENFYSHREHFSSEKDIIYSDLNYIIPTNYYGVGANRRVDTDFNLVKKDIITSYIKKDNKSPFRRLNKQNKKRLWNSWEKELKNAEKKMEGL